MDVVYGYTSAEIAGCDGAAVLSNGRVEPILLNAKDMLEW